jgi:hypothetical protein
MGAFIDRYGYREAVEVAAASCAAPKPKTTVREREPS